MLTEGSKRRLIITTGDTSDVDGFLALAEYSKASYDVCYDSYQPTLMDRYCCRLVPTHFLL